MKKQVQGEVYDTSLEPSDWRYSAAIVGLMQYLDYHDLDYEMEDELILYKSDDITEERYLEFVEYKYGEELHHKIVERILSKEEITNEEIKLVNEKLSSPNKTNTVMKKTFNKIKFDNTNKEKILEIINDNRQELIRETYGKKSNLYANYIDINMKAPVELFKEAGMYCKVLGYSCPDKNRKSNSMGYKFDKSSFVGKDEKEFDFIPFAFEGNREAFFINDNYTIKRLKRSHRLFREKVIGDLEGESKAKDARQALFKGIMETTDFINRDVEVIFKDKDKGYFETLYIRKESIDIFKGIASEGIEYKTFCFSYKVTDKYYINIQKRVTENIINNQVLDELIELFLKEKTRDYLVSQLIKINVLIRGEKSMKDRLKGAFACAKKVAEKLEKNKLESYRQKLTSSIIFKDYDRVCQILLQLSNYSGIEFGFVYDLFDDFEGNKDLAYTFINALSKKSDNN